MPSDPVRIEHDGQLVSDTNPLPVTNDDAAAMAAVLGTTTDAAVTTNAAGTISGKLRGMIVHLIALVAGIGAPADAEAAGDGSVIAVLKRLRTLLGGTGALLDAGPASGIGTLSAPVHGDLSSATDVTGVPTAGQKWVITDISISAAAACEVSILEETSGTVVYGPILMAANGYVKEVPRAKLKLATADKKVQAQSSTADHCTVQVGGYSEA